MEAKSKKDKRHTPGDTIAEKRSFVASILTETALLAKRHPRWLSSEEWRVWRIVGGLIRWEGEFRCLKERDSRRESSRIVKRSLEVAMTYYVVIQDFRIGIEEAELALRSHLRGRDLIDIADFFERNLPLRAEQEEEAILLVESLAKACARPHVRPIKRTVPAT
ncbi:MAG: hypothetical protein KBD16_01285 [Candidatus Pacebacteria bacterium]|nr:hypothetical protein [Candidatus Paceibacterota bacterium]